MVGKSVRVRTRGVRRATAVIAWLVLLLAAGCTRNDNGPRDSASSPSEPAPSATSSSAAPTATVSPTAAPALTSTPLPTTSPPPSGSTPAGDEAIDIVVTGGKVVTKDKTVKVKLGDQVTLIISSDVADEVHVHAYDIKKKVPAGGTIELTFKADLPGKFEIELEGARLKLIELQVR